MDANFKESHNKPKLLEAKMTEKNENVITREILISVADDLNTALGLDPAIDTELEDSELTEKIREEAAQVGFNIKTNAVDAAVLKADKKALKEETWEFLLSAGMLDHTKEIETAKSSGKGKDKGASGKGKDTPAKKDAPAKKAPAAPRYTRAHSMGDAFKEKPATLTKAAKLADDLYAKKGGKSNITASERDAIYVAEMLSTFGVIKGIDKDGNITYN